MPLATVCLSALQHDIAGQFSLSDSSSSMLCQSVDAMLLIVEA